MAGQSHRWGYVQQKQQNYQQQLGRDTGTIVPTTSSLLDSLATTVSPSFTAAVSVAKVMLPLSSSSSSSSPSAVSDTDTCAMEAMKVDPLDLSTCNSQQSSSRSGGGGGGLGGHSPASANSVKHSALAAQGPRAVMFNSNDCDNVDQRGRMLGAIPAAAPTGNSTLPVTTAGAGGAAATGGSSAEEAHRCDMCGKTFAVPARLTRHYRTHTGT